MRRLIYLIGLSFLVSHCTPEFVPDSMLNDDSNAIILPTGDPNGRKGEVVASFLSSENEISFQENRLSNTNSDTFRVSYVSTSQNFDVFKWIFEGGYTMNGSSTTVSNVTTVEGTLDDENGLAVLVYYPKDISRYNTTHAIANSNSFDILNKKDFVRFEYLDNMQITTNTIIAINEKEDRWTNEENGWFSPSMTPTITYTPCPNAMVGFYESNIEQYKNAPLEITKDFYGFGIKSKNLIFEYKFEFLVLPNSPDETKKISLGYTPIILGDNEGDDNGDSTEDDSISVEAGELWSDSSYDVTEFRQVVVPLPLISNFRLSFTKYPSILNNNNVQRYPFTVCIRNVKIVPGN